MPFSDYERMIIETALEYGICGVLTLKDADVFEIAENLKIDGKVLFNAMNLNSVIIKKDCVEFYGEDYVVDKFSSPLFDAVIRSYFIRKNLSRIVDQADEKTVTENIDLFYCAIHNFEMMNANSDFCEADRTGNYTYQYLVYDKSGYHPKDILDLLITYNTCRDSVKPSNAIDGYIRIAQLILKHELYTRSNAIYLVSLAQIISHSQKVNTEIKLIAQDFYLNLISQLKNAKVLSVQANFLYQDTSKAYSERTKGKDNTTRLKIIYGFDNFDAYSMRLDLAHQGEGFVHYNNQSRGRVKCCLFSREEYEAIIKENSELYDCFISYGDRFALKERNQIKNSVISDYETIRRCNEHRKAFATDYNEESIIEFVNCIGNMFSRNCITAIGKERSFDESMYDINQYMMMVTILFLALMYNNQDAEKMYGYTIEQMIRRNVITCDEREYFTNLGDICDLAEILRSKAAENYLF